MAYATGERPGKGTYYCISCKQPIKVNNNIDTIPPCPKCNKTQFTK
ncbi:MAG: hypothetical protein CVV03_10995 [Firmicutes bacterium HGW-Firmicutes-8]|nr:MAG: hypothetical protein CVV03_10995 [Firmicutes bacterium HGW-Firmicutes-8]